MLNILVIGLGSMGKRRLRCFKYIQKKNKIDVKLFGFDLNEFRVNESKTKFNIIYYKDYENYFINHNIHLIIISTPPNYHDYYIFDAMKRNIKFFCEAGIFNNEFDKIQSRLLKNNLLALPSSTMYFHPGIKIIKNLIDNNKLGNISNISYHSGQYLPDWHTYENVEDFYVSQKETGGAREILPFELTWLTKIFGFPNFIFGNVKKTIDIKGAEEIDDTYNVILDHEKFSINIIIDVVSRTATRKLLINGDLNQLEWDWKNNSIYLKQNDTIKEICYNRLESQEGYNKNITEEMYIDEMRELLSIKSQYKPNTVNNYYLDQLSLDILNDVERSYNEKKMIRFMNCGILINISLESTRLKTKHLLTINDKYIIQYLIMRLKNSVDKLNTNKLKIILNISEKSREKYENILRDICVKHDICFFFGTHNNIPLRMKECAEYYGLTHIISVDGDDILVAPENISVIYNYFFNNEYTNYIKTTNFPFGMNISGFSKKLLDDNINNKISSYTVGWGDIFKNNIIQKEIIFNGEVNSKLRITLDYQDDFLFFKKIFENINIHETTENIIKCILNNNIYEINSHLNEKYWNNFNSEKFN